ncbi:hypothetical protein SAMN05421803_101206 [Nocardiopsis flavescens]|uniref:Glycosyl hydrolases family 43 n=1 Tax=Nocardiopsis flavescens TaxID=758803 RepID=A0A1M6B3W9_9ACTN|nr:hypothetical protein SAMN05421803_101206 [Nocardiopsis flavescens]
MHSSPKVTAPLPLWDMLEGTAPRGLLGLSDPNVHRVGDRWSLFVGGFSTSFRNRLYRADLPAGEDVRLTGWRLRTTAGGRPVPLVPDPPRGSWDAGGMHTPCYVPPHRGAPARVYYAGRRGRRHYGPGSAYAVGVLEQRPDGSWSRAAHPVATGTPDRPSALEPAVVPVADGYRMWFLSAPHEVGPGEQPDFELRASDSPDGIVWSRPRTFASRREGFFDTALYHGPDGWTMLLARGTDLHGTSPFPEQGLWAMRADTPSADRADWSPPVRVLDTGAPATPRWMGRGVCGPSVARTADGGLLVFFTGTHDSRSWWREAAARIAALRRPPVPAPYFLATGGARLEPAGRAGR